MGKNSVCTPTSAGESVNVDIRKIENGYVTRESRSDSKGYHTTERFSAEKPVIALPGLSQGGKAKGKPGNSLAKALRSMK